MTFFTIYLYRCRCLPRNIFCSTIYMGCALKVNNFGRVWLWFTLVSSRSAFLYTMATECCAVPKVVLNEVGYQKHTRLCSGACGHGDAALMLEPVCFNLARVSLHCHWQCRAYSYTRILAIFLYCSSFFFFFFSCQYIPLPSLLYFWHIYVHRCY